MRFRLPVLLSLLILLFFLPQPLYSAGFQLKTVGGLDVEGATFTQLWYSNGNVAFTGIALENASVTATIDDTSETVTADSSGNWSYATTLADGDHQVSFTSDGSTVSFTLTIGEVPADIGSLPTATTPAVGTVTPTLIFLFSGIFLISSALFLFKKNLLRV